MVSHLNFTNLNTDMIHQIFIKRNEFLLGSFLNEDKLVSNQFVIFVQLFLPEFASFLQTLIVEFKEFGNYFNKSI